MKLEDEVLLKACGAFAGSMGSFQLFAPRTFHEKMMPKGEAFSEMNRRFEGLMMSASGAQWLVMSASNPNQKALKNTLKATGVTFLASSLLHAYCGHNGLEPKGMAAGIGVTEALVGALCLYRGFAKD